MSEIWPNFFIVGAAKAGSTSLYQYLSKIPGIYLSSIKEPNYFSIKSVPSDEHIIPIRDKKKYLNLFKNVKNEKIIGEASPSYLADPDAPKLIHQVSPQAKILISLRNPIERLYSHYLMYEGKGRVKLSFNEVIKKELKKEYDYGEVRLLLDTGNYSKNVKNYLDTFGNDNVKIIIFEELIKNTKKFIKEILNFLNINFSLTEFETITYNPYSVIHGETKQKIWKNKHVKKFTSSGLIPISVRKLLREKIFLKEEIKPKMHEKDRLFLKNFYKEDVEKLKILLGRELPWDDF